MQAQRDLDRPKNYRKHLFRLFGQDIQIAGMAAPDKNDDHDAAMKYT